MTINRDLIGGIFLIGVGLFAVLYGLDSYSFGSAARMGSGYFPVVLGGILALLGAGIALVALVRGGAREKSQKIELRPLSAIVGGILVFAVMIELAGFLPAAFTLVMVSGLARTDYNTIRQLILATVLAVGSWLLFSVLLGIPLPAFEWGF